MDLLRKKELHEPLGLAKSTVADWITDFHVFIPTVKHGAVTYYKPETIDVLLFIKSLREENKTKAQIMILLSEKGFPITIEEAVEDMRKIVHDESQSGNYRDTLMTVIQTMGQAVTELADQNKTLEAVQQEQDGMNGRISDVERKLEKLDEVELLRQQIEELKAEIAATKEQKKSFLGRLFGR